MDAHVHLPTLLWFSAGLMLLAAVVMTLFGLTQRIYRGYWWWAGAAWLAAVGIVLRAAWAPSPLSSAVMQLFMLQWPLLTLTGLRQFHARQPLPGPAWLDTALLGPVIGGWAAAALFGAPPAWRIAAFAAGSALLYGWSASRLLWAAEHRDSTALRTLGLFFGVVAGMMAARACYAAFAAPGGRLLVLLEASGAALAVCVSLLMGYLALLLTHERTEQELRDSRRRLRVLANTDMLTRVPNRRHFQELARRVLQRDPPGSAVMVMFDIDHFKRINDVHGHAAGDRALKLVSRCAQETLRAEDIAGRQGGDEFVLLLPKTDVNAAMAAAARIVSRVQSQAAPLELPPLSLSFGVVQTLDGETLDQALHRADQALYEAKRQGRGRAVSAAAGQGSEEPVFVETRVMLAPGHAA